MSEAGSAAQGGAELAPEDAARAAIYGLIARLFYLPPDKDLLGQIRQQGKIDLAAAMREPLYVTETMPALKLLDRFKTSPVHMAVVLDEHGMFQGIATPTDILIAIAGEMPEGEEDAKRLAVRREDGAWELDGQM